jgi:hypothetical protein
MSGIMSRKSRNAGVYSRSGLGGDRPLLQQTRRCNRRKACAEMKSLV